MGNQMIDDDDDAFDDDDDALCTQAWLLIGLTRSIPGVLESADGRFTLTTEDGCVFDVPLSEVTDVNFPWYYFGGGVKFKIGIDNYRLSFVQPNDADDVPYHLLAKTDHFLAKAEIGDLSALLPAGISKGRRAGKSWKSALGFQTDS
jgi:hypothetical protein